ncbi:MAG: Ribosome-binding factor A [Bacteroidetes bacterium ADurb.Bin174]|nr:MAG: Ribosome-binding factor A [Bacteroidetes bacterium ADurb.Bin174]
MKSQRQEKIARMLQKELGEIFMLYARKMKGILISVTKVNITPDLSIAHISLSIFPSEKTTEVMEQIGIDAKTIRYDLGRRVKNMRIVPELIFHIDDSLDYLENIDRLLKSDPPSPLTEEERG